MFITPLVRFCALALLMAGACAAVLSAAHQATTTGSRNLAAVATPRPAPCPNCSPLQWPGKRFVILPKTTMLKSAGYELFTVPRLAAKNPAPLNEAIELADHRLKCEPFQGKTITITQVKPLASGEYSIQAIVDTSGLPVFAQTRNHTVEGLVYKDDLDSASRRWIGKTIYARRRFIEVYDTLSSNFSQVKISITEPLTVIGVTWGRTPLPPQPLWIHVCRKNNIRGIIATRLSWINVQPGLRATGNPWDEAILEENARQLYRWDQGIWDAIDSHSVFAGMTRQQVLLSWGTPRKQSKSSAKGGGDTLWQWLYDASSLKFKRDTLLP